MVLEVLEVVYGESETFTGHTPNLFGAFTALPLLVTPTHSEASARTGAGLTG